MSTSVSITPEGGRRIVVDTPLGRLDQTRGPDGAILADRFDPAPTPAPGSGPGEPEKSGGSGASGGSGGQDAPPPHRIDGPGTWLTHAIRAATLGLVRPCAGCKSRARRLDAAGWRGAWRLLPGIAVELWTERQNRPDPDTQSRGAHL